MIGGRLVFLYSILSNLAADPPKAWKGYWIQPIPAVPEKHYFDWNLTTPGSWNGTGKDNKGDITLTEIAGSSPQKFQMTYSGGYFSCQEMIFTITSQETEKVKGDMTYKGCKYKDGQELIGNKGTWQAEVVTNATSTTKKPYEPKFNDKGEEIYVYET